ELATGVCLCIVDLVDVRPMGPGDANKAFCPAHPDLFSWVLENVRPIRAVAFKGQQGLFKTDLKPIIL
ncbi:MAG: hypothetical protein KAS32_13100, partial [Candidatus Peribacteraceae bacterium]|nr:hypothetical protein [Candidatus Peribacteraceae bacterium]